MILIANEKKIVLMLRATRCLHSEQQLKVKKWGYWDALSRSKYEEAMNENCHSVSRNYNLTSANQLARLPTIPPNSKLLTRDFIHNSLYHPTYGYFSKRADVLSLETAFDFNTIRDTNAFYSKLSECYKEIEDAQARRTDVDMQVWHTPSELFKPWYGYATANYIISSFKNSPSKSLIIYEVGAGFFV